MFRVESVTAGLALAIAMSRSSGACGGLVGSGTGAVAPRGSRSQGLYSGGFPSGCASLVDMAGLIALLPAPAASNRACSFPANGFPTSFTGWHALLPNVRSRSIGRRPGR